jgi:hypothetical protein
MRFVAHLHHWRSDELEKPVYIYQLLRKVEVPMSFLVKNTLAFNLPIYEHPSQPFAVGLQDCIVSSTYPCMHSDDCDSMTKIASIQRDRGHGIANLYL